MEEAEGATLEQAILNIPDVRAVRVVSDSTGKPVEVHVVAGGGKTPKQIVRDVQTVAQATSGVALDHRIVSVVQFPDDQEEQRAPVPAELRVMFEEISTETRGTSSKIKVVLNRGDQQAAGESAGITSADSLIRLAAGATIDAVKGLHTNGPWLALEDVQVHRLGSHDVAIATVIIGPGPQTVSGSALVMGQPTEAAVKAVLDALNRRLFM
jgi:ribosomal protein S8E